MKKYKCIIIDDESYAVEGLKKYIDQIPQLVLVKEYTDPLEALFELASLEAVDLILMDINMPQITGIELSKEIRQKTRKLVFTTAYSHYGYQAFEVEADAYLLKPYTLTKFAATITKLFPEQNAAKANDFFLAKNKDEQLKMIKVKYSDVIAVESKQNYVLIHTLSKNILTYISLTEISKSFSLFPFFVQFQRSFIINENYINSIDGNSIKMVGGLQLTVGDYYRKDFTKFLIDKLIKPERR